MEAHECILDCVCSVLTLDVFIIDILRAYIAQGEVLPVATRSFGGIGIFAIPEMGRFYRHVLIEKNV